MSTEPETVDHTRRSVFRGLPLAAIAASMPAMLSAADADLLVLERELDEAWNAEREIVAMEPDDYDAEFEAMAGMACARTRDVVHRIQEIDATSLHGIRVKAKAMSWCHSGRLETDPGHPSDINFAFGIVQNILRLA